MTRLLRNAAVFVGVAAIATVSLAARGSSIRGSYVEARTAEGFTGGLVQAGAGEAETMGREAVLAWNVERGSFNGVSLDGMSVVAAVVGNRNLGIYELGGEKAVSRSALFVDDRANPAQRLALVAMASQLANGVLGTIVNVTPTSIQFNEKADEVNVTTSQVTLGV